VFGQEQIVARERAALGSRLVDKQFFERRHGEKHLTHPWGSDALNRKREDLFAAALMCIEHL
jgi:hypothetical protein